MDLTKTVIVRIKNKPGCSRRVGAWTQVQLPSGPLVAFRDDEAELSYTPDAQYMEFRVTKQLAWERGVSAYIVKEESGSAGSASTEQVFCSCRSHQQRINGRSGKCQRCGKLALTMNRYNPGTETMGGSDY